MKKRIRKEIKFQIRLSVQEKKLLACGAERLGVTESEYIRILIHKYNK